MLNMRLYIAVIRKQSGLKKIVTLYFVKLLITNKSSTYSYFNFQGLNIFTYTYILYRMSFAGGTVMKNM